jgi:hypothetical protein
VLIHTQRRRRSAVFRNERLTGAEITVPGSSGCSPGARPKGVLSRLVI